MLLWQTIVSFLIVSYYEAMYTKALRKFVYKKDVSEHCRRRVMPSVFLGRHVVEANSQILQFSQLNLPYSCFISIRSEAGSNIILFIQLLSEQSLATSCARSNNQVLVYEMGETFGGYWGPLPSTVLEQRQPGSTKFYTLKTTLSTTASTTLSTEETTEEYKETTESPGTADRQEGDYIRMEIPIVNVSGVLVPSDVTPKKESLYNDAYFDIVYDVKPWRNETYQTSLMPIVQFSNRYEAGPRRFGVPQSSLYGLQPSDKPDDVTFDERLIYPTIKVTSTRRTEYKSRYRATKRLRFGKSTLFSPRQQKKFNKITTKFRLTSTKSHLSLDKTTARQTEMITLPVTHSNYNHTSDINNIFLDSINQDEQYQQPEDSNSSLNTSMLMLNIANMEPNNSVNFSSYLALGKAISSTDSVSTPGFDITSIPSISPNLTFNMSDNLISAEIRRNLGHIKATEFIEESGNGSINITTLKREDQVVFTETEITDNFKVSPLSIALNSNALNASQVFTVNRTDGINNIKNQSLKTTSTVDHESWENVVQAAPAIASVLNQTMLNEVKDKTSDFSLTVNGTGNASRRKRNLHPISISDAKPHYLIARKYTPQTTKITFKIRELDDFLQLAELPDDEMHGRVALRYLRHFVGPVMFNICDYSEATDRQVFLFNSSHIVMALSNFSIDRMTAVVTPARTVLNASGHCSPEHLECQVSGARVCVNTMCACDGIPNCGSYDIYDEDRLLCGASSELRRNVWLAAIIFLAVVLTVLYTVHYWLKRCVPNVSQAFFIYTNGGENELYLEPIMRSPYDVNLTTDCHSQDNFFEDGMVYMDANATEKRHKSIFAKIFSFFKIYKSKTEPHKQSETLLPQEYLMKCMDSKKQYSFTEYEIRKNTNKQLTDAAIQTGDSLEAAYIDKGQHLEPLMKRSQGKSSKSFEINDFLVPREDSTLNSFDGSHPDILNYQKQSEELNVLKFFKDVRSDSTGPNSDNANVDLKGSYKSSSSNEPEREIVNHMYDQAGPSPIPGPSAGILYDTLSATTELSHVRKHLRFDEDATAIPSDDRIDETESKYKRRSSFIAGVGKIWRALDLETIDEDEEVSSNSAREHRSFWGSSSKKGKKGKKNTSKR